MADQASVSGPLAPPVPVFRLTPPLAVKVVLSVALSCLGIYYLHQGKQQADLRKMLLGAALVLLSLAVFA